MGVVKYSLPWSHNVHGATSFQADSTAAFQIQNSSSENIFSFDTTNAKLSIDGGSNSSAVQFDLSGTSSSDTEGPNYCSSAAEDASYGSVSWSNGSPSDGCGDDGTITYGGTSSSGEASYYLKLTDFGFSIPAGATVDGITVEFKKSNCISICGLAADIVDSSIRLVKGGSVVGNDKATSTPWPDYNGGSEAYTSYGGSSDTWSTSLTPSDVNSSNFGVVLSGEQSGSGTALFILDATRITVDYTDSGDVSWTQGLDTDGNFKLSQSSTLGTNDVLTVGSNGNITLQNTFNSTQAFQVQNAAGSSVFNVDSVNNQIELGGGTGGYDASDKAVAQWHLNEASWNGTSGEAVDSIGGYDGTSVSGADTTASGKLNRAGDFTGSLDNYVSIPDDEVDLSGDWSVGMWINLADNSGTNARTFAMVDSTHSINLQVGYKSTTLYPYVRINNTVYYITQSLPTGSWKHVVYVSSGGTITIYVDGTGYSTTTGGAPSADTSYSAIGSGSSTSYNGNNYIDDVVLYDDALSSSEVAGRYNSGSGTESLTGGSYANLYSSSFNTLNTDSEFHVQTTTNSTTALQVQNSSGSTTVLGVDTTNGRVGIGTNAPSKGLEINYAGDGTGIARFRNTNASAGQYWNIGPDNSNNFIVYNHNNTGVWVGSGGTSWNGNSDERLKTNIQSLDSSLSKILQLAPITYQWKDVNASDDTHIGFLAQDVQQLFPELVSSSGATTTIQLADGSQEVIENTLGIDYTSLIVPTIQAVKELNDKVDNNTISINQLSGTVSVEDEQILVSGDLSVSGDSQLAGNLDVAQDLNVTGQTVLQGNLTVSGTTNLDGDLSASQNFSVTGKTGLDNDLTVTGKTKLQGDLEVTGASKLQQVMASSIDLTGNAAVNQLTANVANISQITAPNATITTLNVSGTANIGTLHITGNSVFDGKLTIGKAFITKGNQPTIEYLDASWKDDDENTVEENEAEVAINGNDIAGTITLTTGSNPVDGELLKLIFNNQYANSPRVIISPANGKAADLRVFRTDTTGEHFILKSNNAPEADTTYKYDYFIIQTE